jgi:predicted acyl esterase
VAWYVEQGYAVVLVNVRGTGLSGAEYEFLSREEQQDHYEVIDWISSQPWSNQRVGGYGSGYSATAQWNMASQFSRNLQCIAPHAAAMDPYSEWVMQGGVRNSAFIDNWYETRVRDANAFGQPSSPTMVSYDLLQQTRLHPTRDTYWQQRSPVLQFPQINTPVFVIHPWARLAAGTPLAALAGLQINWKMLLLSQTSSEYRDIDFHARYLLPYYDWCLKQEDTSYPDQPAVRFTPENSQIERDSDVWPPPSTQYIPWNLDHTASESSGPFSESLVTDASEQLSDNTLRYRSAPLVEAKTLTGPVMLELHFTPASQNTVLEATLLEEVVESASNVPGGSLITATPTEPGSATIQAQGTRVISTGVLRASLRTSNGGVDKYDPVYSFTQEQLMVPGRSYRIDLAMKDAGYQLSAGSRLILEVRLRSDGTLPDNGGHRVLYGTRNPSRLWLPVNEEAGN